MDTRQIKEMAFLQDIQELDKMEKEREFKSSVVFLGETLMTDGHIGQIQQGRQEATEDMEFNKRQEERMMMMKRRRMKRRKRAWWACSKARLRERLVDGRRACARSTRARVS